MYVCVLDFSFDPLESHFKAFKKILHYLVGITNQSLFYKKNQDFKLVGYCKASYVEDRVEQKGTSGGFHYIRPCLIPWTSKKKKSIALSILEVEYVSTASCCSQLLWVKH